MPDLLKDVARYSARLDKRAALAYKLDQYYEGAHPLPPIVQADQELSVAYQTLMRLSRSDWPSLIVDACEDRLEVQGMRFGTSKEADKDAWEIWQDAGLDGAQSQLHVQALATGRAYAIVWGNQDGVPEIVYEHPSMCLVEYESGSSRVRKAGFRRWKEGDQWYANIYTAEMTYKFRAKDNKSGKPSPEGWEPKPGDSELANPLKAVNVVEFAINRTLKPDSFGTAAGEFERHLAHIDRINYRVFCGIVAMTWSGFPLRALLGEKIKYDKVSLTDPDTGEVKVIDRPRKPFDALASAVAQFENPEAKLQQMPGADIDVFSPEMDIKHLASLTKTPANYLLGDMVNISADAIRAGEAALISKCRKHHRTLGEAHEEVMRLAFRAKDPTDPRGFDQSAQVIWKDPESRSLAERADAAVKLSQILPWQALAEYVLNATPQEINKWESMRSADAITNIVKAIGNTPPQGNGLVPATPGSTPPVNGNPNN